MSLNINTRADFLVVPEEWLVARVADFLAAVVLPEVWMAVEGKAFRVVVLAD